MLWVIMVITVIWTYRLDVGRNLHSDVALSHFIVLFQDIVVLCLTVSRLSMMVIFSLMCLPSSHNCIMFIHSFLPLW